MLSNHTYTKATILEAIESLTSNPRWSSRATACHFTIPKATLSYRMSKRQFLRSSLSLALNTLQSRNEDPYIVDYIANSYCISYNTKLVVEMAEDVGDGRVQLTTRWQCDTPSQQLVDKS